jgi:hypothetical protein
MHEPAHQRRIVARHRRDLDELAIAARLERALVIDDERSAAAHSGGEVATGAA